MKQQWTYLTGFGLAIVGAICALSYILIGGREQAVALVWGVGLLGIAQLVLLSLYFEFQSNVRSRLRKLAFELDTNTEETRESFEAVFNQLTQLEHDQQSRDGDLSSGIAEIKTTFNGFRDQLAKEVANQHEAPIGVEQKIDTDKGALPAPVDLVPVSTPPHLSDQVSFALEPVVDLPTKRTAHYRLHAAIDVDGEILSGEEFYHTATAAGIRPLIDKISVNEALSLLVRLRQRDPQLCILVPLGADTLQDESTTNAILAAFENSSSASGLIIEVAHVVLAGLGEKGLEALALMARAGIVFALSQASVGGLDIEAMKLLNVKLVGLSAANLAGDAPSQTLLGFAHLARLARVGIYVTDVSNADTVPHLEKFARLACGPCFASPRRVRRADDMASIPAELAA